MNCIWPATRITCRTNINSKTCRTIDSFTQRLAQGAFRPYSISPVACCRRDVQLSGTRLRKSESSYNPWTRGLGLRYSRRFYGRYDDLPEDYDDQTGLEYRDKPVTKEESYDIFGGILDARAADRILRVLHGRRVAGTLPDPDEPSGLPYWEKVAHAKGLDWLRKTVPLDEDYNAVTRAELELAELEGYAGSSINIWRTNDKPGEGSKSVYGESGLDYIRKVEQERLDALEEKAKKDEAKGVEYKTGTLESVNTRSRVELRRPGENPRLKYYLDRAEKVLPDAPPDMTVFERLFPSGLVVLLTIGGVCTYAYFYTPPARADRLFPDIPPAFTTVTSIILLNLAVYALWHHPPAFIYLNKYFLAVPGYPRALSMIGCMFSHQQFFGHLLPNMFFLYFVGHRLHDEIGRGDFIAAYLGVGALASFVSLAAWVVRRTFVVSTLGASGAIYGVISTYLWLDPRAEVRFFGSIPPDSVPGIPAWVLLLMLMGPDLLAVTSKRSLPVKMDHWAHLGGFGGGILAAEILKRTREKRRVSMTERRNKAMMARQVGV
ncbi:rhomboid family protein [Rutstroemia sp. NJR-2017a BBW]|nr:rhomboid family protein [Rutstroemia sp. NJR-2017a BBW]